MLALTRRPSARKGNQPGSDTLVITAPGGEVVTVVIAHSSPNAVKVLIDAPGCHIRRGEAAPRDASLKVTRPAA